jgi:inner membrane protein
LVLASLIVSATHPFLDWTNNYGVRLLLPWSSKWFYGDLVFIADPFIWLLLGSVVFLLTARRKWQLVFWGIVAIVLTYLMMSTSAERGLAHASLLKIVWFAAITSLVLAYRFGAAERWGRRLAWSAFIILAVYWMGLGVMHSLALKEIQFAAAAIGNTKGESVTDIAAMPTLANPFRWLAVVETDRAAYRFETSITDDVRYPTSLVRLERADTMNSTFLLNAAEDRRAKIFLGFARFPVYRVVGADCLSETVVQLADLRYTQPGSSRGTFALEVPVSCPPE